jgi:hypothetical protein
MSRVRAGVLVVVASLVAMTLTAGVALAAAPQQIAVDPADSPLQIQGFVGEPSGFSGSLRLHASGAPVASYQALFSDLRADGRVVSRSHLTLSGPTALAAGQFVDAKVTVDGIDVPGRYSGQLELVPAGQPRSAATVVPIEVDAIGRPALTALAPDDRIHGALARCGVSCGATAALVPGSAGGQSQTLAFAVGPHREAVATDVQVLGAGDRNGHQLTNADLGMPDAPSAVASRGGVLTLHFRINPADLPADHYTGTVRVTVANVDEPVTVPIDFTVRDAPYLALLALALGIGLGRLSKFLAGPGGTRRDLYARAGLLRRRAKRERDDALLQAVEVAQHAIDDDDLEHARRLLDAAEQARPATAGGAADTAGTTVGTAPPRNATQRLAAAISPVETELGLGAHLIGVATWIGLLIIGFQTLYVQQGLSFGANGIFDYVALVLWGLSADVVGRGLGNLTGGRAAASAAA